jgi:hypothetical protein
MLDALGRASFTGADNGALSMIELFVLYQLCTNLGRIAREKGRGARGYQLLLVLLWVGAEFVGSFLVCLALFLIYGGVAEDMILVVYAGALATAVVSAWIAFRVVRGLPARIVAVSDSGLPA